MKFSVVYSFYNEEKNIPEVIRRTRDVLAKMNFKKGETEIIFINDNSRDGSEKILREYIAEDPSIKLINTTRNFGNAACILAGFSFTSGEYVGYLDTDLQDPPEMLEQMYHLAVTEKLDIVHTKRTKRHGEHPMKLLITKLGYAILGYSMSVPLQSNVGDFKVISRRVVQSVLTLAEPLPFIRGMIAYVGFKERTIEYEREARFGGETNMPVYSSRVISNFVNNALISYSDLPVHMILLASGLGLAFSVLIAAYAVWIKMTGVAVPGSTGILLVMSVFCSLILFSIGVIGLYLSSIKKAVLRRPTFLVESTIGFSSELTAKRDLRSPHAS